MVIAKKDDQEHLVEVLNMLKGLGNNPQVFQANKPIDPMPSLPLPTQLTGTLALPHSFNLSLWSTALWQTYQFNLNIGRIYFQSGKEMG